MRRLLTLLALVAVLAPCTARADDKPAGIRGEIIDSMKDAGDKIQDLAGAIPDKKWNWTPGKGVRTAGQVFQHVAQGNYLLGSLFGGKPPISGDELKNLDTQAMEPAKARDMLRDSYAWAEQQVRDTPDSDLDTQMDFFGQKMTKRAGMLVLESHSHEHLGQLIAYARTNNIVPPWTARELAEAKAKEVAAKAAEKEKGKSGK